MGYILTGKNKYASFVVRTPPNEGVDGWFDDALDFLSPTLGQIRDAQAGLLESTCLQKAETSAAIAGLNAQIDDISKTWRPSGYYSPDQIVAITQLVNGNLTTAQAYLSGAKNTTSDAASVHAQLDKDLQRKLDEAKTYSLAAAKAVGAGIQVVEAQGLRMWVLHAMVEIGQAMAFVAIQACQATLLDTIGNAFAALRDFLLSLAKIVVAAGQAILKVPSAIIDLWAIIKWGAIGGAAWLAYEEFGPKKGG